MRKIFWIAVLIICFPLIQVAQSVAIGHWRDHLPYNKCIAVAEAGSLIYCATPYSLFYYNKEENSIERLNKINGLSDVGISNIKYSKTYQTLVIAYSNTNIDLIKNNTIINISDIKRKPILGNKTINDIYFRGHYAYLACGFGIVVLDLIKDEIKDTYYIGPDGSYIDVLDITSDNLRFYAATESGIYLADVDNPSLANYENWNTDTLLPYPQGKYNHIEFYQDKIFVNNSNPAFDTDTLYYFSNNLWIPFDQTISATTYSIRSCNGNLVVSRVGLIDVYDNTLSVINKHHIYNYPNVPYPHPYDAIVDRNEMIWIADEYAGMVQNSNIWDYLFFTPNGPYSANVYSMSIENSHLWVASGGRNGSWGNLWNNQGAFSLIDEDWGYINGTNTTSLDTIFDLLSVAVNPFNSNQVYAGSWGNGLLEYNDGALTQIYNEDNSSMQTPINSIFLGIAGLAFDETGHLWITSSRTSKALSVKKINGNWQTFDLSPKINENEVGSLIIDSYGQKWMILPRDNALLVFYENGTFGNTSDDKTVKLNVNEQNDLSTNFINCLAEDLDGEIWIGTDKGIKIYYSPELVFETNDFYAQTILVEQDGYVQHLLEFEEVTAIAIDGSNRKWIGTSKAGVFLMSEDGTEQIHHFTEDNSPLLSSSITSIVIDHNTGEIFFGTTNGIISYKGTSTKGGETYSDVYAYPNPVKETYNGLIAVKGLVTNADVKITDISGNIIFETVAEGGQAVWNGKNYSGERAQSGVYLVFCSNNDGSETLVTKILFIN